MQVVIVARSVLTPLHQGLVWLYDVLVFKGGAQECPAEDIHQIIKSPM